MARILAIDYGTKRTGMAVTDPEKIIATGLATVPSHAIIDYLKKYLSENEVECFVVGEPKQMNNLPSESAKSVNGFIRLLNKKFPDVSIKRMDERFTSKMAVQTLINSGLKKKDRQNKALLNEVSATIILQSYLESIKKN